MAISPVINIHGPIVSSGDLDVSVAMFRAFGLEEVGTIDRDRTETRLLWDIEGHASREITMATPGTPFGVRLVRFDPSSAAQIRFPDRGSDSDALKVMDFYAPDLEAAIKAVADAGFHFKDEIAEYDTADGRHREAHLWGPDGVVCALVSGDPEFYAGYATVCDRLISEPQSISGPVQDQEPTLSFLKDIFGLETINRYGLDDESFQALVGTSSTMKLRAWNVGVRNTEPYFGVINYGMAPGSQTSLTPVARPPSRGLLGATMRVGDVEGIADRAGVKVVAAEVPGFGAVRLATVPGPNGCWFQALELGGTSA